jgi:putative membrane protein insertion efficiency factor
VMRLRRLLWLAGGPLRLLLLGGIWLYRVSLSGWLGGQCRFVPTCSRYAEDAIRTHGAVRGSFMAAARVARCNPFGRGGLDPVPEPSSRGAYDSDIHPAGSRRAG